MPNRNAADANRSDRGQIVVVADDLSGAAELAGIAYAHGCTAEVQREFDPASEAEVIAVDTNSRGLAPEIASEHVRAVARAIIAARPRWIFKKVDSLLRGNVLAEIEAMLAATGQARTMLIPANPSRGRTIADGRYFIEGVPLDQTALANDPEHPRSSSAIRDLLGGELPRRTLSVPNATSVDELRQLSRTLPPETLAAGAADFFTCLLEQEVVSPTAAPPEFTREVRTPALFVCGSKASWSKHADACAAAGVPVQPLMPAFLRERLPIDELPYWSREAAAKLKGHGRLLLGIGPYPSPQADPAELAATLARLTMQVLERAAVATLLVDGGTTAAAVVRRLGWNRFAVASAAPAGIGVLRPVGQAAAPQVWIKPGSYPWPVEVWSSPQ